MSNDTIICPGCGWIGSIDRLSANGACPNCGYENNTLPWRLLTIGEMMQDDEPYNDVRMDLFLRSLSSVVTTMHVEKK